MLRLNKEPPKPLAVTKTSGQGPPERVSAVGTFKSSAAGQPPCISFSDGVRLLGQEVQLCKNTGLDATLYSLLAGDTISESLATFTSTISGEPVEQALGAVQRLFGSLPDASPTDPIPFNKCSWNTGVTFFFKGPLLDILESYSHLGPRYAAENPIIEFRLVEVCSQFKSYGLCNCVQG